MIKKCTMSINNDGRLAFDEKQCLTARQKEILWKNAGLDEVAKEIKSNEKAVDNTVNGMSQITRDQMIAGYYMMPDGSLVASSSRAVTDFIPCNNPYSIRFTMPNTVTAIRDADCTIGVAYDENKNVIGNIGWPDVIKEITLNIEKYSLNNNSGDTFYFNAPDATKIKYFRLTLASTSLTHVFYDIKTLDDFRKEVRNAFANESYLSCNPTKVILNSDYVPSTMENTVVGLIDIGYINGFCDTQNIGYITLNNIEKVENGTNVAWIFDAEGNLLQSYDGTKIVDLSKSTDVHYWNNRGTFDISLDGMTNAKWIMYTCLQIYNKANNGAYKFSKKQRVSGSWKNPGNENFHMNQVFIGGSVTKNSEATCIANLRGWNYKEGRVNDQRVLAVGGAGLLQGTTFISQWEGLVLKDKVTEVIIWYSTNDYTNNKEIGVYTDYSALDNYDESKITTTCCGAFNYLVRKIRQDNPTCKIKFMGAIPTYAAEKGWNKYSTDAKAYWKYTAELFKCCDINGIPYLDQWNLFNATAETKSNFMSDNIHPNDAGYKRLYAAQGEFIDRT